MDFSVSANFDDLLENLDKLGQAKQINRMLRKAGKKAMEPLVEEVKGKIRSSGREDTGALIASIDIGQWNWKSKQGHTVSVAVRKNKGKIGEDGSLHIPTNYAGLQEFGWISTSGKMVNGIHYMGGTATDSRLSKVVSDFSSEFDKEFAATTKRLRKKAAKMKKL